jgi:hypothetical protein
MFRGASLFALALFLSSATQALAWQKGYPFPTDLRIPLDEHHSLLLWLQGTPQIELDFTKHGPIHGEQSSDSFPTTACVVSETTDSSSSTVLVEEAILNLPLPLDVSTDLKLAPATKLLLKLEMNTNFPAEQCAYFAELDAVDSMNVVAKVLFQGQLPFNANAPATQIPLGQEGHYFANPSLTCK